MIRQRSNRRDANTARPFGLALSGWNQALVVAGLVIFMVDAVIRVFVAPAAVDKVSAHIKSLKTAFGMTVLRPMIQRPPRSSVASRTRTRACDPRAQLHKTVGVPRARPCFGVEHRGKFLRPPQGQRWFFLHSAANGLVVLFGLRDVVTTVNNPVKVFPHPHSLSRSRPIACTVLHRVSVPRGNIDAKMHCN